MDYSTNYYNGYNHSAQNDYSFNANRTKEADVQNQQEMQEAYATKDTTAINVASVVSRATQDIQKGEPIDQVLADLMATGGFNLNIATDRDGKTTISFIMDGKNVEIETTDQNVAQDAEKINNEATKYQSIDQMYAERLEIDIDKNILDNNLTQNLEVEYTATIDRPHIDREVFKDNKAHAGYKNLVDYVDSMGDEDASKILQNLSLNDQHQIADMTSYFINELESLNFDGKDNMTVDQIVQQYGQEIDKMYGQDANVVKGYLTTILLYSSDVMSNIMTASKAETGSLDNLVDLFDGNGASCILDNMTASLTSNVHEHNGTNGPSTNISLRDFIQGYKTAIRTDLNNPIYSQYTGNGANNDAGFDMAAIDAGYTFDPTTGSFTLDLDVWNPTGFDKNGNATGYIHYENV